MQPKTYRLGLIDEIKSIATGQGLNKKDIDDLVKIAEDDATGAARLNKILTDHKLGGKLNAPQIDGLIKFFEELSPLFKLLSAIAKL